MGSQECNLATQASTFEFAAELPQACDDVLRDVLYATAGNLIRRLGSDRRTVQVRGPESKVRATFQARTRELNGIVLVTHTGGAGRARQCAASLKRFYAEREAARQTARSRRRAILRG